MRTIWRTLEALSLPLLISLGGCAGPTFSPETAPEYLVTRAQTPFYQLGPQQAAPPERRLAAHDRLRMLRREFGYSFTLLDNGETGYVANEDLAPAPPLAPAMTPTAPRPEPSVEHQPNVEEPLPKPDMERRPADAPAL